MNAFSRKISHDSHALFDIPFYRQLIDIGLPITMQSLIMSGLNFADTLMIGQLGEVQIASVGIANQIFFILSVILHGITSGGSIYIAQFFGKKDERNIRRVLGITLTTAVFFGFLFLASCILAPSSIMRIFTPDPVVIDSGVKYLFIVALSYPVTAVTFSYAAAMRGVRESRIPMYINLVALCLNIFLNYVFIFGNFGMPSLGVAGAALATSISRTVELALGLAAVRFRVPVLHSSLKDLFSFPKQLVTRFFGTVIPIIINQGSWVVGVTLYSAVYARISTQAIAAVNILKPVESLAWVLFHGVGNSAAVLLGNTIGRDDENSPSIAWSNGKSTLAVTPLIAVVVCILLNIIAAPVVSLFNVSDEVALSAERIIRIFSYVIFFKSVNFTIVIGILRSGGDTTFSFLIDFVGVWLVGLPAALISGLVFNMDITWVFFFATLEEVVKVSLALYRFASKKWIRNMVHDIE